MSGSAGRLTRAASSSAEGQVAQVPLRFSRSSWASSRSIRRSEPLLAFEAEAATEFQQEQVVTDPALQQAVELLFEAFEVGITAAVEPQRMPAQRSGGQWLHLGQSPPFDCGRPAPGRPDSRGRGESGQAQGFRCTTPWLKPA
jgi:hypothetical protein